MARTADLMDGPPPQRAVRPYILTPGADPLPSRLPDGITHRWGKANSRAALLRSTRAGRWVSRRSQAALLPHQRVTPTA